MGWDKNSWPCHIGVSVDPTQCTCAPGTVKRLISEHLCCSIHRYRSLYIYGVGPLFERLPTACIRFVKQRLQSLYQFQPKMSLLTFGFSRKKRVDDTEECDGETLRTPAKLRRCDNVVEAVKAAESKAGECECEMIKISYLHK